MQFYLLMKNPLYVSIVVALCGLLYVVTGIQYWSTIYFLTYLRADPALVFSFFAVCCATGPTVGVILGGLMIDKVVGGYRTREGLFKTLATCVLASVIATGLGVLGSFLSFFPCIACIWLVLFFGGTIVPAATGILVASVDSRARTCASGLSMCWYNLFGYALGSFLPGFLIDAFGISLGFKSIFFVASVGVVGICAATFIAWKRNVEPVEAQMEVDENGDIKAVIRKRRFTTKAKHVETVEQPAKWLSERE